MSPGFPPQHNIETSGSSEGLEMIESMWFHFIFSIFDDIDYLFILFLRGVLLLIKFKKNTQV